ncbi:hypothetical protein [Microcella sp.]|uniref:hypothetical protein n=1 Tax=Microcella sp. TaxID=1913979 RepID=UPI00299F7FCF|nr:hypothetical protein [Microcella sp.]MDX2026151.1 hypothetical protein [Microcella sp.]
MTFRVPTLVTPLALVIAAGLLVGCSSPADSGGDTVTEPDTSSESSAPDDSGTDLGLPAQTVGSDTDCSFLADDQVAAVWGFDVVDLDISMVIEAGGVGGILYGCDWNQSDDGTGLTIGVEVTEYVSADGPTQAFADALSGAEFDGEGGIDFEPLAGVGEEAAVLANLNQVDTPVFYNETLMVRSGALLVEITVTDITGGVTPAQYRDQLVATYEAAFGG